MHSEVVNDEARAAAFPLLAEPQRYVACRWDLSTWHAQRDYWLGLFRGHFPSLLECAVGQVAAEQRDEARRRADAAASRFYAWLDKVEADPARHGRLDILFICEERERVLRAAGFDDPYRDAKHRENVAAMAVLPRLLAELDVLAPAEQAVRVIEGVFAGNIFDLGATATNDLFRDGGGVDFHATRVKLKPRPWLIDDLDAWCDRLARGPAHRCAVLFVDNAGPDVLLGMLPLTRFLLRRGTGVILTANSTPSLNDVTHEELAALVSEAAGFDAVLGEALRDGRLTLAPSGNGAPLIDLLQLSTQLVAEVRRREVDLVVLEGMGRAVESNLDARFRCDALKLAMIKDQGVADAMGGGLYDLVCRFEAG